MLNTLRIQTADNILCARKPYLMYLKTKSHNSVNPWQGYKPDLKGLPKVSFGAVWWFMIEGVETKTQLSTAKPLVKRFNLF